MMKLIIQEPEQEPRAIELDAETYTLGRGEDCDIVLADHNASRQHSRIRCRLDELTLTIEDLESSNGSYVNGARIVDEIELRSGDEILIGYTKIRVAGTKTEADDTAKIKLASEDRTQMIGPGELQALLGETSRASGEETEHNLVANVSAPPDPDRTLILDPSAQMEESEITLKPGEKIETGKDAARVAGASAPASKRKRRVVLAVLAVVSFGLLFLAILKKEPPRDSSQAPVAAADAVPATDEEPRQTVADPPPDEAVQEPATEALIDRKTAEISFDTANRFLEHRLWEEAIIKFGEVLKLDPEFPGVADSIGKAEFEKENQGYFESGISLAASDRYEQAVASFERISQASVYHNQALLESQALRNKIKRLASAKEVKPAAPKTPAPEAKPPEDSTAVLEKAGAENIAAALQDYAQGQTKAALKKLDGTLKMKLPPEHALHAEASTLKQNIVQVQTLYDKGLKELNSGQSAKAFQTWAQSIALDQQIIGQQKSYFANRIAAHMADEFYRRAQLAYDKADYVAARENSGKAFKAQPDHKGAMAMKTQLERIAKKLYEEGYILEDLSPGQAVRRWREVLAISWPDSEYYGKAQARIDKYADR